MSQLHKPMPSSELLPQVILVLLMQPKQKDLQGRRLALVSKHLMIEVGRNLLSVLSPKGGHPMRFLEQDEEAQLNRISRNSCQWLCVVWAIVFGQNILPPLGHSTLGSMHSLHVFMRLYHHSFRGKLAMAREVNPDCKFTFHIVTRWLLNAKDMDQGAQSKAFQEKASKTGGELAVHKFICVRQAEDALLFLQRWAHVQKTSHGALASCMMECGPSESTQTRKWIIDLDGKLEDLRALGFLKEDEYCLEAVCPLVCVFPSFS